MYSVKYVFEVFDRHGLGQYSFAPDWSVVRDHEAESIHRDNAVLEFIIREPETFKQNVVLRAGERPTERLPEPCISGAYFYLAGIFVNQRVRHVLPPFEIDS